jgi:glycosyltransferase involved in cell wall biosynthesis
LIKEGSNLLNEEINFFYRQSIVVWNAYNRTNQSGVLPKAYMFGCAVVVLNKNANEFIENHVTGVLIESNDNLIEIKDAIEEVINNKERFYLACRSKFLNTFYYKARVADFEKILK